MKQSLIVVFGLVALLAGNFVEAEVTTRSLVENAGYPFEAHQVQTEDGYLLGLHRIPRSPKKECTERQVAFLMHGLLASSADFVVLGPNNGLGYYLADNCFDVWMGNSRGNRFSRKHVSLNPDSLLGKFWDFSIDDIGKKDLPAMIDYIRNQTGSDELRYIGHSIGTTFFFVLTSTKQEYQNYIKSADLMSPLIYADNLDALVLKLADTVIKTTSPLPNVLGPSEFNPNGTITKVAGAALCDSDPRILCSDILFVLAGFNNVTVDPNIISDVLSITPAGMSTKTVLQCFQQHDSGRFQEYDYGFLGNIRRYGTSKPPRYPVENVKVPINLYWSEADRLIHKQDVDRIVSTVPNVKEVTPIPMGTHTTFVYNSDMKRQVYEKIVNSLLSMQ